MAWLWLVDTSHHTDYVLLLAVDCFVAAMTLATALFFGLELVALGLASLFALLLAATAYAWSLWKQEEAKKGGGIRKAVKIRAPR